MPVMPVCRQPIIDFFTGGTILSLHATGLYREDGTPLRGTWPYHLDGPDSLRLTGAMTTQVGAEADPSVRTLVPQNLSVSLTEHSPSGLDRELHRVFVPTGTSGPSAVHATLLLAAEPWDGTTRDAAAQDVLDRIAPLLEKGVSAVVHDAAGHAGPAGPALRDAGVVGWTVPELADAVRDGGQEDFALGETALLAPRTGDTHRIAQEVTIGGLGDLTCRLELEWRVTRLPHVDEVLHLQVHYGEYVVAEGGGKQTLIANRPSPSDWETFGLIRLGEDRVALLAPNGDFLTAADGGGREVFAGARTIGAWETFRVETIMPGRIALRADNGHYVSAFHGGGRELVANRPVRDEYEVFTLHHRRPEASSGA